MLKIAQTYFFLFTLFVLFKLKTHRGYKYIQQLPQKNKNQNAMGTYLTILKQKGRILYYPIVIDNRSLDLN